jgi:hypothetical protein
VSDLFEKIKLMQQFGQAIQTGLEQTISALPALTKQQIAVKARNKLHSTLDEYLDAVKMNVIDDIFIVELDKESWIANAVELGVSGFDMKKGMFNSPKAKISKEGFKYVHIPMSKDPKREASTHGTDKSQYYQRILDHVMRKPKFNRHQVKSNMDGSVTEIQKLITDEPEMQGLYRSRKFTSADKFHAGKGGSKFQYVLLRTVSEKNSAEGKFVHPGITAANIFKDLERDIHMIFETLLDKNIQENLRDIL